MLSQCLKLTQREFQVLEEVVLGGCIKVAACNLKISPRTIEEHLISIKQKLNIQYKYELNKVLIDNFYVRKESA